MDLWTGRPFITTIPLPTRHIRTNRLFGGASRLPPPPLLPFQMWPFQLAPFQIFPNSTVGAATEAVAAIDMAAARMMVFMVLPSRVGEAFASKKEGNLSMGIDRRSDGGHRGWPGRLTRVSWQCTSMNHCQWPVRVRL